MGSRWTIRSPLTTFIDTLLAWLHQNSFSRTSAMPKTKMIQTGSAISPSTWQIGQERTEPWIMPSYTQRDLDDTLQAFQSLVDAICVRMPNRIEHPETSLIDLVIGGDVERLPSNSFAYRLLSQAKVPPFIHIAPGLRIANHQPFAEVPLTETSAEPFPLLLFTSTELPPEKLAMRPRAKTYSIRHFPTRSTPSRPIQLDYT